MKTHTLTLILAVFVISTIWIGCGKGSIDDGTVVSVIYSTDTRGKLEGCGCKKNGGGITKRAAKIESARTEDGTVLYLDSGNFLTGTSEVDSSKGAISVAVYNQLGVNVVNVSERELAFGIDAFKAAKKNSTFAYVSANVRVRGSNVADAYTTLSVKGAKVAVVGLCGTRDVMRYDSSKLNSDVIIVDPIRAAKDVIPSLEGSTDLIIVLSTCGDAVDSALAQSYQMIDLIIGGRSYRPNSDAPWVLGNTRILRADRDGRTMGRIDLVFGQDRKIKTFSPATIHMETGDPSSEKMLELVRKYIPTFADSPAEGVRIASSSQP
jgi:5'-nucleotidase